MALSPDEKFIYVNPDTTSGEYNTAQYFPVKYLRGLECASAANFYIYFRGPKDAKSTRVTVNITSGFIKDFFTQFVDEVNFGENAVITLADRNIATDATTGGTDFQHVNAFVSPQILSDVTTSGYEDVQVAEDLDVAGVITGDLTGDVTGNADTATALETARAINGVDFDGTGAITITAAGSTLSDTVPVSKGGTGATSLTTDGVLFGNGTSAVSAVDLSTNGNIVVGGSTPAAVTGANLAGSGLAATVGNGTLVLAVETLNQDTTGSAATLTTPRAINGVDFDGSAPITVTSAGSTLSDTVTVAKGGTGLTTVGTNNILTGNGTGALTSETTLQFSGDALNLTSASIGKPEINLTSTHTTQGAQPKLSFYKASTGENGENIGSIDFAGNNDDDGTVLHAQILGEISEETDGEDGGRLTLSVASHDATLVAGLVIEDGSTGGEVDATIGSGAASVTTVGGTLTMGSTPALTNAGLVAVANQSNITGVGTISSGVWEGTTIKTAYIGDDQVTEDKLANTLLAEIDANTAKVTNSDQSKADINALDITEVGTIDSGVWQGTAIASAYLDADTVHLSVDQEITSKTQINKRQFSAVGASTGDCEGDIIYFGTDAASHVAGNIYTLNSSNQWVITDADATATSIGLLAVAMGTATTDGMCLRGMANLNTTFAGSPANGAILYLDNATAGAATGTAPTGNGDIVRVLGYKIGSGTRMWFNPDNTFVEVTA